MSIATLTDAVATFIDEQGLGAVDVVGSSMGARMALELAPRRRAACCLRWRASRSASGPARATRAARLWAPSRKVVLPDLVGLAAEPSTGAALDALTKCPKQRGAPAGTVPGKVVIGWGRRDLVTVPRQAVRAVALFPDATLHWFERSGHFPQWDMPRETVELILKSTV